MKDLVAKINAEFETFKTESESLTDKGVKAAGARARKSTLELEKLLKPEKVSMKSQKNNIRYKYQSFGDFSKGFFIPILVQNLKQISKGLSSFFKLLVLLRNASIF